MIDLETCSDGELAALALGGLQAAYGVLMRRHRESVFRLARAQTGSDDDALEVTQQSFISAFLALRRYDGTRPFRHWIARIALNKCHDWARRRQVRRFFAFALPLEAVEDVHAEQAGADRDLEGRQALARAMAAIVQLPARLKDVLVLRTIEGLSQAETSSVLGISEKAVETRLYRARAKLSERLRD